VRFGQPILVDRPCDTLGVECVVLSIVLAHADQLEPRRVDDLWLVAPTAEQLVHVPGLARRLEADARRRRAGPNAMPQIIETLNTSSVDDLAVAHLAVRDVACSKIESYASHDRSPFGPQHLWL